PSHIVGTVEALLSIAATWEAEERSLTSYRPRVLTTVVVGEYDRWVTVEGARALAAVWGAQFNVIPKAGHWPQLEQPGPINRLLSDLAQSRS
ncbi:MAG: alpha/beta hydrolase, partial [Chloroflexi bacterium]|nr:alpha/beta hydrolase [Chloroflexota bacterium]